MLTEGQGGRRSLQRKEKPALIYAARALRAWGGVDFSAGVEELALGSRKVTTSSGMW